MKALFSVLVACATFLTTAVYADAEAEIKYRQAVMKSVGGHMGSMGAILRGRVHFDDLKLHADSMASLSMIVPGIFPEGSGDGKTEALSTIWEEPEEFKEALDRFASAAKGMSEAASSGDPRKLGPAIQSLGQSCKGCHDDFREEHD